jgi:hypothetical protein
VPTPITTLGRWAGTPNNNVDISSASFTPGANALLAVAVNADTQGGAAGDSITIQVAGGSLSWSNPVTRNPDGVIGGYSAWFWAITGASPSAMTIDVRRTAGTGGSKRISCKCYQFASGDFDPADPMGTVGSGTSTTNNLSPTVNSSTEKAGSRTMYCGTDWNALGTPTSTDTEDAAHYAGAISVMSAYKAADNGAAGSSIAGNLDASGSSTANWTWAAIEVNPAPAGGVNVAPGVSTYTASAPSPSPSQGVAVAPALSGYQAAAPAPTPSQGAVVIPAVSAYQVATPTPTPSQGALVTPTLSTYSASAPTPTPSQPQSSPPTRRRWALLLVRCLRKVTPRE